MTAWEFVQKLGPGWNLGDTFDSIYKHPNATAQQQETAWHNPVTTSEMIKMVSAAGFKVFRLPVTWAPQMTADYKIKDEWMQRVNQVVDYGIDAGMTVILNLHHEDWHHPTEENYPKASEILKKVWPQIATHFQRYGHNLIFEAMNEPRKVGAPVEWNGGDEEGRRIVMKLNQDFVDAVRQTGGNNATRMLMVPTYAASSHEAAFVDVVMPKGDNIILSVHSYDPYDFALGEDQSINTWLPEYEKIADDVFGRIDKYFLSKGIPVIMGECGARRKGDNVADRVKWAAYYKKKSKEYGIPCLWWDNGRLQGCEKTELFGLLNRRELKWEWPEIVEAFVSC